MANTAVPINNMVSPAGLTSSMDSQAALTNIMGRASSMANRVVKVGSMAKIAGEQALTLTKAAKVNIEANTATKTTKRKTPILTKEDTDRTIAKGPRRIA